MGCCMLIMLLAGIHIIHAQETVQQKIPLKASSLQEHVQKNILYSSEYSLHEYSEQAVPDLTFFEWMQKWIERIILSLRLKINKIFIYVCSYGTHQDLAVLQEKLAECCAELGSVQTALYYSEQSLLSSVQYLNNFVDQISFVQNTKDADVQIIENVRDQFVKYTQHVQAHIITMTDFADEEKDSQGWHDYEEILMQYFEKMQQVMQNIDECDALLCQQDSSYCMSDEQRLQFENLMHTDFDPDVYD